MTKRPRLTVAEIEILLSIIGFVAAGEIDGGPLSGETPKETTSNVAAMNSAEAKLADMLNNRSRR